MGTCGECKEERHVSIGGFDIWGNGCGEDYVDVSTGMLNKLCCKAHICSVPTTTTTTTLGCPSPASKRYTSSGNVCQCPGGYACSTNARYIGCGYRDSRLFDPSCRTCQCYRTQSR